jgi:hypothetical protein
VSSQSSTDNSGRARSHEWIKHYPTFTRASPNAWINERLGKNSEMRFSAFS